MEYYTLYGRPYFEMDNTEGFTQEQLDRLNAIAVEQITADMSEQEIDSITEKILQNA